MSDNQPIQLSEQGNVAYLPAVGAVVTMRGLPPLPDRLPAGGAAPTKAIIKPENTPGYDDVVSWGAGNDFPQQIIRLIEQSTIIPRAITDIVALWIGGGVIATIDDSETMIDDQEIRDFLTSRSMKRYWVDAASALATWWNAFPELILSKDRSQIVQMHVLKTPYCRWGRMDPKTGLLNKLYVNANWPESNGADETTVKLPVLDPMQYDLVDWVRRQSAYKYVWPVSFPSEGKTYYQLAAWDSTRSSGWLDVLAAIPQFKKYAMRNQMSIRYHIEVDQEYWERVYGERWDTDYEGKMAIRNEFLQALMDRLTNVQNANKGILTDKWTDTQGKPTGVTITVLDDKHREGKYNEDYSQGVMELLAALGIDPTLYGYSSGKEGGRSGGSDKREAFWIFVSKSKPFRDRLIEPLEFVSEFNGWKAKYPTLTFKFRDTLLTTLDTGKSTATHNTPSE